MARMRGNKPKIIAVLILLLLLIFFTGLSSCEMTPLLSKVRELVLTGKWDDAVWDKSIFGD